MIQKPYGKFNLEQLQELSTFVNETRELELALEKVFREAEPQKINEILGDDFSWFHFHKCPLIEHATWGVLLLDWKDELAQAAKSEDPQKAFFDFMKQRVHVLQEMGGWELVEMVRHYAHLSSEHLAGYVDRLSAFRMVGEKSDSYDLANGNKKGLDEKTSKPLIYMELVMGLEPATG